MDSAVARHFDCVYLLACYTMYATGTARCGVSRMDPDHETRAGGGDASSVRGGGEEPAAEAIATEPTAVPQCINPSLPFALPDFSAATTL